MMLEDMVRDGLLLLVIVNPFGHMVYLADLMNQSTHREFLRIYLSGALFGLLICLFFALVGEFVLFQVFHVSIAAMRIFGGMIILSVAYTYIVHGPNGLRLFRGEVSEIAQRIALPLTVGPGVIWMSIRIGKTYAHLPMTLIITSALAANALLVLTYFWFFKKAKGPLELAMIKYFAIAMRLNALIIGAISIDMILSGISEYYTTLTATGS
jgi:small neutral amino acid transporter SnatA (MarC family)